MTAAGVIHCVESQLGLKHGTVKPESVLEDELGADSLDRIEIVMAIEDEFAIMIDDEKADAAKTVADLIATVDSELAKEAASRG